jgi:ribonucleotide reductase class II
MMELAMMGSGTGAILEKEQVAKLPQIFRSLKIKEVTDIGKVARGGRDVTTVGFINDDCYIEVGDSRQGWCDAYQALIDLAMSKGNDLNLIIDLTQIRPVGSKLKGFGGTANPVKLPTLFKKVSALLSNAKGRQLTPLECCLLIDEAAACIVAGNIRRSAGMRQFSSDDAEAATAKLGLYSQDEEGNWRVDPIKENLRMANHTRCFHSKPTLEEVKEAVTLQVQSGEGAIQYVPEAIARSNHDLLPDRDTKNLFIATYEQEGKEAARDFLAKLSFKATGDELVPVVAEAGPRELDHRMMRYGLNPCGEILGEDFHCNLSEIHLNTLDPENHEQQMDAFRAGALEVASLLFHQFKDDRYSYSREIDPIVGVSFTGLFDFFVKAFGADWLEWMFAGRPTTWGRDYAFEEAQFLSFWRTEVEATIHEFCHARGLKAPNRMTTVQPAGTKSLLTGASSGWHPPKAQRFIRRITFGAYDPVAMAAIDAGYSVIPAPSSRDEEGNLLDDIHDPRSAEWLVEIPTEVPWANLPGVDKFDLHELSARAQFGLWMNVQQYYTAHNTSATIELQADEIDELSELIYESIQQNDGYISAALLQRFDARSGAFPRLPFEPIDKETYEEMSAQVAERKTLNFRAALQKHDDERDLTPQESACSSAACLANAEKAEREGKS